MIIAKVTSDDLEKLLKQIRSSRFAQYVNVSVDGPRLQFSFEGADQKLVTVTLFDSEQKIAPTLTKTESL